jgi:hypothetical protein
MLTAADFYEERLMAVLTTEFDTALSRIEPSNADRRTLRRRTTRFVSY